jgi:GntR family transcriptional regulator, transcriptional repressor for pyruvate dehydrogenase complex
VTEAGNAGSTLLNTPSQRVFTSIDNTQRTQLVREQLESAISRGTFKPGARLPSERELVEQFGVSRVSIREALRSLEALGMIEIRRGRGSFVASELAPVRQWLSMHSEEVVDLLKVRGAVERLAAEEAARRQDQASLTRLSEVHADFVSAVDASASLGRLVELDVKFHRTLADASGSPLVAELTQQLNSHLAEARRLTMMPPGRPRQSAREHDNVVQAVLTGNASAASRAMRKHVQAVEDAVVRFSREQSDAVEEADS